MPRKNPHQTVARPMGAAVNFWGEPYAHPSHGSINANQMPRKSAYWPGELKPVGATTREQVGHFLSTNALPTENLIITEVELPTLLICSA
jgi:hypothetical protein